MPETMTSDEKKLLIDVLQNYSLSKLPINEFRRSIAAIEIVKRLPAFDVVTLDQVFEEAAAERRLNVPKLP